jgi:hypothetical protein
MWIRIHSRASIPLPVIVNGFPPEVGIDRDACGLGDVQGAVDGLFGLVADLALVFDLGLRPKGVEAQPVIEAIGDNQVARPSLILAPITAHARFLDGRRPPPALRVLAGGRLAVKFRLRLRLRVGRID